MINFARALATFEPSDTLYLKDHKTHRKKAEVNDDDDFPLAPRSHPQQCPR